METKKCPVIRGSQTSAIEVEEGFYSDFSEYSNYLRRVWDVDKSMETRCQAPEQSSNCKRVFSLPNAKTDSPERGSELVEEDEEEKMVKEEEVEEEEGNRRRSTKENGRRNEEEDPIQRRLKTGSFHRSFFSPYLLIRILISIYPRVLYSTPMVDRYRPAGP